MRKTRTRLGALALGMAAISACHATATQDSAAAPGDSAPQAQPASPPVAPAEDAATARARQALRNGGVDDAEYELAARQAAQWNDSSLGCPKPGMSYLQVLTSGEVLRFTGPRGAYEVHVAGETAVLCAPKALGTPKRPGNTSARNLDKVVDDARQDLHAKLGVEVAAVRLIAMTPAEWPDSSLGCAEVAADLHEQVSGYKLLLSARGRQYIYHTDLQRTFACPPIEAQ